MMINVDWGLEEEGELGEEEDEEEQEEGEGDGVIYDTYNRDEDDREDPPSEGNTISTLSEDDFDPPFYTPTPTPPGEEEDGWSDNDYSAALRGCNMVHTKTPKRDCTIHTHTSPPSSQLDPEEVAWEKKSYTTEELLILEWDEHCRYLEYWEQGDAPEAPVMMVGGNSEEEEDMPEGNLLGLDPQTGQLAFGGHRLDIHRNSRSPTPRLVNTDQYLSMAMGLSDPFRSSPHPQPQPTYMQLVFSPPVLGGLLEMKRQTEEGCERAMVQVQRELESVIQQGGAQLQQGQVSLSRAMGHLHEETKRYIEGLVNAVQENQLHLGHTLYIFQPIEPGFGGGEEPQATIGDKTSGTTCTYTRYRSKIIGSWRIGG